MDLDSGNINAIISAASGLAGVIAGSFLSYLKDRRVEKIKDARDGSYLAILVVSHLDRFAAGCLQVALDDGTSDGQPAGENGYHKVTVEAPAFSPLEIGVEWKVLPRELMYEILQLPNTQERVNSRIAAAAYYDEPPDYTEYLWTRRREYAELGLCASSIAKELRCFAGMPIEEHNSGSWDRDGALREIIADIDSKRAAYERRQTEAHAMTSQPY